MTYIPTPAYKMYKTKYKSNYYKLYFDLQTLFRYSEMLSGLNSFHCNSNIQLIVSAPQIPDATGIWCLLTMQKSYKFFFNLNFCLFFVFFSVFRRVNEPINSYQLRLFDYSPIVGIQKMPHGTPNNCGQKHEI